jgi:DNA-binding MarR family transcriptional regulator
VQDALNFSFLLLDVSRLFLKRYASRAADYGFTVQQAKALGYLKRNEGISQVRLAELCDLEPMALTRIVERMESDGWITRSRDVRDRRSNCLFITPDGERIHARMRQIGAQLRAQIISGVSLEERAVFINVLEYLYATLLIADEAPGKREDV